MPFTSLIFDTAAKSVRPIESAKLGQKVRIVAYAQKSTKQKSRTKKKAIARVVKSSYLPLFKTDSGLHNNASKVNLTLFTKVRSHSLLLNFPIKELDVVVAPFTNGIALQVESIGVLKAPSTKQFAINSRSKIT